ncbi:MAG: single-stranded-DNA-specific exonuclease RecJ [Legionellales bacterium]|jgi:single-stranded-DNA-specific exonuclease
MQKIIIHRLVPQIPQVFAQMHPVLARIYASRGISAPMELKTQHLLPYQELKGIQESIVILADALKQQKRILFVGDFDADGATSVAVGVRCLRMMGAAHIEYLVPNRFEYGYGLTPEIVKVAQTYHPDLIITVDNGISSVEGVAYAKSQGIQVLITDHHLPPAELPNADAIVNPNQHGDLFASKHLAGVGVIFYVMLALRAHLRELNWFVEKDIPEPNLAVILDLVALGTVADVVALDANNRILVHQGLQRIKAGHACVGIQALIQVAQRNCEKISASDLGFAIAPRLNAAGRLQDMSLGIACLLSDNLQEAIDMALQLDTLNQQRRSLEAQMKSEAMAMIDDIALGDREKLPTGVCLYDEKWHQGVVGILAGRIKERLQRPVICFAKISDQELKGSARSIPGLHIRDLLEHITCVKPELIMKFGGHAMAAGLSILPEHFLEFAKTFDEHVAQLISVEQLNGFIETDGELASEAFSLELAETLKHAGPWGQAFPEPLFDGEFEILNQQILSEKHVKCHLRPIGSDILLEAISFFVDFETWPKGAGNVRAVYRLDVNEFRGQKKLQLMIEHCFFA